MVLQTKQKSLLRINYRAL